MRMVVGASPNIERRARRARRALLSAPAFALYLFAAHAAGACDPGSDYVGTRAADMNQQACSDIREAAVAVFCRGRSNHVAAEYEELPAEDYETCVQEISKAVPQFCRTLVQLSSKTGFACVKIPASVKRSPSDTPEAKPPAGRKKSNEGDEPRLYDGGRAIEGACKITRTC